MSIDGSRLKIDVRIGERWRRTLQVTVPADIVEQEREQAARKLAGRLKLKGFRKGRVPASVLEKRYGPSLQQETLDQIIGEAYREALRIESLRPISEGEVEDIQFETGSQLTFLIAFDVSPEIELSRLGGFRVERPAVEVSDEDLKRVVERLREQNGVWKPVDEGTPEEGDLVSVEIRRFEEDGELGDPRSYDLVLGQGDALPDVEKAIQTLSPGKSGTFTVRFPDDFPDEERRGEEQRLQIDLDSRKIRELPDLTDEFARSLGDFANLADLRSKVGEDLAREAEAQADGVVRSRLVNEIVEANRFDVPRSMVDRYLDGILGDIQGVSEDKVREVRESLQPEAEAAVKRLLLIERVAESQSLRPTAEEVDGRVETIAKTNNISPSEVYAQLQRSGRLESLEREITERKVLDFLAEQSEIVQVS
jgi:trigger factor